MSCGVGRRQGSEPALLWLWHRLAATAPIGPLAWEPPHATGVALKSKKKGVPVVMQWLTKPTKNHAVTNLTNIHAVVGSIPGLAQWVNDPALP